MLGRSGVSVVDLWEEVREDVVLLGLVLWVWSEDILCLEALCVGEFA